MAPGAFYKLARLQAQRCSSCFLKNDPLAFAIHYSPPQSLTCCSVFLPFLPCVHCLFFPEINEVNSFLTQPGPYYVNVFSLFLFPLFFLTHELGPPPQKLYQMVNLIIETKEPNGSPSSLHASGSEKRSHLWELI